MELIFQLFKEIFFFAAYVNTGSSFPEPLTAAQEADCLHRMREGDDSARGELIEHNLRLVAHIAKKYVTNTRESDDIISIGTIGLIKAVSTYDAGKGTMMATYASRCIENEILMALRAEKKTNSEVSLHDPIGTDKDGNEVSLSEILGTDPDQVMLDVESSIAAQKLRALIAKVLTRRERTVIELRYGITGGRCMAQREVAALLDISRSYVSRIEKKALQKLNAELSI